ncbi:MAG: GIN domain-containing protein [Bacteroidota bacterium]
MKTKINLLRLFLLTGTIAWTGCAKDNPTPNPNPTPISQLPPVAVQPFYNIVITGLCKVNLVAGAMNHVDTANGAGFVNIVGKTLFVTGAGEITISVKELDSLVANGASFISSINTVNLDHPVIIGNAFSQINMKIAAKDSIIAISNGLGPYIFSGTTPQLHLWANGVGFFKAFDLISEDCTVTMIGAGESEVYASKSLIATIAGLGTVYYKGNPPSVTPYMFGLGFLVKK